MNVGWDEVLVFVAEVACYVAVGVAGWRVHPAVAVAAVGLMATWWGAAHSPRAPIRLPLAVDRALRVLWFAIGFTAACWAA